MTGSGHMILWEPETLRIIKEVEKMRKERIPAWYSMDTGPSVFVNTLVDHVQEVVDRLHALGVSNIVTSKVGDKPVLSDRHLF
jgi:mevalonate pyrophosphate decarboxylase